MDFIVFFQNNHTFNTLSFLKINTILLILYTYKICDYIGEIMFKHVYVICIYNIFYLLGIMT